MHTDSSRNGWSAVLIVATLATLVVWPATPAHAGDCGANVKKDDNDVKGEGKNPYAAMREAEKELAEAEETQIKRQTEWVNTLSCPAGCLQKIDMGTYKGPELLVDPLTGRPPRGGLEALSYSPNLPGYIAELRQWQQRTVVCFPFPVSWASRAVGPSGQKVGMTSDPSGRRWRVAVNVVSHAVTATPIDPPRSGHEYVWNPGKQSFVVKAGGVTPPAPVHPGAALSAPNGPTPPPVRAR